MEINKRKNKLIKKKIHGSYEWEWMNEWIKQYMEFMSGNKWMYMNVCMNECMNEWIKIWVYRNEWIIMS